MTKLTIEHANEIACEMHNSLPKAVLVALVEELSGEAWADVADNDCDYLQAWLLECDGQRVVQSDSDGSVLSAGPAQLTATEAAEELGVTTRRVTEMIAAGQIEGVAKFGRSWAIPARSLDAVRRRKPGRPKKP